MAFPLQGVLWSDLRTPHTTPHSSDLSKLFIFHFPVGATLHLCNRRGRWRDVAVLTHATSWALKIKRVDMAVVPSLQPLSVIKLSSKLHQTHLFENVCILAAGYCSMVGSRHHVQVLSGAIFVSFCHAVKVCELFLLYECEQWRYGTQVNLSVLICLELMKHSTDVMLVQHSSWDCGPHLQ